MGDRQQAGRRRREERQRTQEDVAQEDRDEERRTQDRTQEIDRQEDRAQACEPLIIPFHNRRASMRFLILVILLLLILGALPTWPYSAGWGYYPSGIGLIV